MIGLYKVANLHRMSFAKVRCPIEFHLLHVKKKKKKPVDSWKDAKVGWPICTRFERSFQPTNI